jgi:signal transduction histidine kinase
VTLDLRAHDLAVGAPREALAQALLNLMLNAITHSPAGGRVALWAHDRGDTVQLTVRDSGHGIAPADRERVFQPFTSNSDGGVGLGLSVVRRLADELGWTLEVDDAPGGGAELRITVPAANAAPVVEAHA